MNVINPLLRYALFSLLSVSFSGACLCAAAIPAAVTPAMGPDLFVQSDAKPADAPAALAPVVVAAPAAVQAKPTSSASVAPVPVVSPPVAQKEAHVHHAAPKLPAAALPAKTAEPIKALKKEEPIISEENKARLQALDSTLSKNVIEQQPQALAPMPKVEKLDPLVEVSQELEKINKSADDIAEEMGHSPTSVAAAATPEKPVVIASKETPSAPVSNEKVAAQAAEFERLSKEFEALKMAHDRIKSELSLVVSRIEKLEKSGETVAKSASSLDQLTHAFSRMGEVVKEWFLVPFKKFLVSSQPAPVVVKESVEQESK